MIPKVVIDYWKVDWCLHVINMSLSGTIPIHGGRAHDTPLWKEQRFTRVWSGLHCGLHTKDQLSHEKKRRIISVHHINIRISLNIFGISTIHILIERHYLSHNIEQLRLFHMTPLLSTGRANSRGNRSEELHTSIKE